jgi:hypothetical protein
VVGHKRVFASENKPDNPAGVFFVKMVEAMIRREMFESVKAALDAAG